MRTLIVAVFGALVWSGVSGAIALGQGGQGAAAQQAPRAPAEKAAYFANTDFQSIWKDLEAKQVINKRVLEAGNHSINVRIVKENDAPLVHARSADAWVVTAGTATAVTGGQLVDSQKRRNSDHPPGAPMVPGRAADGGVGTPRTATAVTGGQLVHSQKRPNSDDAAGASIQGGTEQPLKAGDVLYVPQGVPHGFKNVKDFRAFLIRFDTN